MYYFWAHGAKLQLLHKLNRFCYSALSPKVWVFGQKLNSFPMCLAEIHRFELLPLTGTYCSPSTVSVMDWFLWRRPVQRMFKREGARTRIRRWRRLPTPSKTDAIPSIHHQSSPSHTSPLRSWLPYCSGGGNPTCLPVVRTKLSCTLLSLKLAYSSLI